ncbi:hypothetical protein OO17_09110 [Rhodopseudomonas palustris]|jgi:hypothetical protein|uniref:Uncharacterized protein n=1 Tax=Rhodopseudomonas palustris TaxID=1076 RepID=A0A0D7EW53_RHOPL|nr:hypothetical protein OO17_09110 [Rhodopseudomonas palustris]
MKAFRARREAIERTLSFLFFAIRPSEANTDPLLLAPDHPAMLRATFNYQRKGVGNFRSVMSHI